MIRTLAIIVDDRIDNLIVGNPADFPEALDVTDMQPQPAIGWMRAAPGEAFEPPAAAPVKEDRRVTRLAFRARIGQANMVKLELASEPPVRAEGETDAAFLARRSNAAGLRVMLADVAAATYIDLARADTRAGVNQLEAATLLPAGSAALILDAPIQPHERPASV